MGNCGKSVSRISDWREIWQICYLRCHEGAGKIWGRFEQIWVVWAFHRTCDMRGFGFWVKWLFGGLNPPKRRWTPAGGWKRHIGTHGCTWIHRLYMNWICAQEVGGWAHCTENREEEKKLGLLTREWRGRSTSREHNRSSLPVIAGGEGKSPRGSQRAASEGMKNREDWLGLGLGKVF
jgi:hypothetical protein